MFEEELQFEEKQGRGFGPLILVVALAVLFVGGTVYTIRLARQTLSPEQAASTLSAMMPHAASTSFTTGPIDMMGGRDISKANYKLLANIGVIKIANKGKGGMSEVSLTPEGEKLLASLPGVSKKKDSKSGDVTYHAPLAERRLVSVQKIDKLGVNRYQVTYEWRWEVNALGRSFDMQSKDVECLNNWEKQTLIDKHGGAYYQEKTMPATVILEKTDEGWRLGSR